MAHYKQSPLALFVVRSHSAGRSWERPGRFYNRDVIWCREATYLSGFGVMLRDYLPFGFWSFAKRLRTFLVLESCWEITYLSGFGVMLHEKLLTFLVWESCWEMIYLLGWETTHLSGFGVWVYRELNTRQPSVFRLTIGKGQQLKESVIHVIHVYWGQLYKTHNNIWWVHLA